jgi:hypothetical protein
LSCIGSVHYQVVGFDGTVRHLLHLDNGWILACEEEDSKWTGAAGISQSQYWSVVADDGLRTKSTPYSGSFPSPNEIHMRRIATHTTNQTARMPMATGTTPTPCNSLPSHLHVSILRGLGLAICIELTALQCTAERICHRSTRHRAQQRRNPTAAPWM